MSLRFARISVAAVAGISVVLLSFWLGESTSSLTTESDRAKSNIVSFTDINGKRMTALDLSSQDDQCAGRLTTHQGRAASVHVDVKVKKDLAQIDMRFELQAEATDPIVSCLRSKQIDGSLRLIGPYLGLPEIVAKSESPIGRLMYGRGNVVVDQERPAAAVKIRTSTYVEVPLDDLEWNLQRAESSEYRKLQVAAKIKIEATGFHVVTVRGGSISRQADSVIEISTAAGSSTPISIGLALTEETKKAENWQPPHRIAPIGGDYSGYVLFPISMLAPWLALLWGARGVAGELSSRVRFSVFGLCVTVVGVGASSLFLPSGRQYMGHVLLFGLLPSVLIVAYVRLKPSSSRFLGMWTASLSATVAVALVLASVLDGKWPVLLTFGASLLVVGLFIIGGTVLFPSGSSVLAAAALGVSWVVGVLTYRLLGVIVLGDPGLIDLPLGGTVYMGFWVALVLIVLRALEISFWPMVAAVTVVLLALIPVGVPLFSSGELDTGDFEIASELVGALDSLPMKMFEAANVALVVATVYFLRKAQGRGIAVGDMMVRAFAVAALMVMFAGTFGVNPTSYSGVLLNALSFAGLWWLLGHGNSLSRGSSTAVAVRLASLTQKTHARLLRLESRRRSLVDLSVAFHRSTRSAVTNREVDALDAVSQQASLDVAAGLYRGVSQAAVPVSGVSR